jgi:hypothetical protein
MKTISDVRTRLRYEIVHWSNIQRRNTYAHYYLYYMPNSPEHDGGLGIFANQPPNPNYQLACPEALRRDMTIDQNFQRLFPLVLRLPILSE